MPPVRKTVSYLAGVAAALLTLPACAADAELRPTGLPQLDTSKFPEQLFWLAISFVTLYVLMTFIALPGVRRTQETRKGIIAGELAAATAANEQAKAMAAQVEKALADARAKAQATVSEIKAQAAKEAAEQQSVQQKELSRRLHEAETKIKASRDAAIRDAQKSAADLSASIVDKIAGLKKAS